MLPGASSTHNRSSLVWDDDRSSSNRHSSISQPNLQLQVPESNNTFTSTVPLHNDEFAKLSAQWTMAEDKVRRDSAHSMRFDLPIAKVFLDRDGALRLSSLESWERHPQASIVGIQRLA